ncbi:chemotaxis protein CheD [uncultured Jannaschia sp.]|uniref:chemotaxis protein CheD n=1 Tax=uncultured Jannaschia sp. TaxID=293347 RepID=UPI00260A7B88|nr:chemotaxis protein CheD [uncultured Jannaschia sp.]
MILNVAQGTHAVSTDPEAVITTVLGSCVAACLFDAGAGLGGMNHFLLPESTAHSSRNVIYGAQAMELLINDMMKKGAHKERMRAKLFGGARMVDGLSDIGAANAAFALQFLEDEGIPCIAASLGGKNARRLRFWPTTGRATQKCFATTAPAVARPAPAPVYTFQFTQF